MALYGYACVSTHEQDLTLQTQTLRAAGCEIIRSEKASGSSRDGRTELSLLLEFLRPGDIAPVSICRLLQISAGLVLPLNILINTLNCGAVMPLSAK